MKQATIECTEDNRDDIYNFLSSLSKGEPVNIEEMRGPLGGALLGPMAGPPPPATSISLSSVRGGNGANARGPAPEDVASSEHNMHDKDSPSSHGPNPHKPFMIAAHRTLGPDEDPIDIINQFFKFQSETHAKTGTAPPLGDFKLFANEGM